MCPQDFVTEVRVEEEKRIKMYLAFAPGFKHVMHFIHLQPLPNSVKLFTFYR